MLKWSPPDNMRGEIRAAGGKGWYTIRWQTRTGYTLTGYGHDDLPMLVLPPYTAGNSTPCPGRRITPKPSNAWRPLSRR